MEHEHTIEPRTIAIGVLSAYVLFAGWYWHVAAQAPRKDGPFRVLVEQTAPPVTVFEHRPTGACFVAYGPGGVVVVDSGVCKTSGGGLPIVIPIPIPPISPER